MYYNFIIKTKKSKRQPLVIKDKNILNWYQKFFHFLLLLLIISVCPSGARNNAAILKL